MRIERLDLIAFGPFTDVVLDLDGPGFQVIFGPNEAGKTTARAAIANLLFGIELRTPYDFVHSKPSMRLGARVVDDAGTPLEIVRYKRRNDDLMDAATNEPVPPGRWAEILGGRGEEDYRSLYTVGRDELVNRTKDLLRSGGVVEAAVFAAGLGRANLGEVLDGLASESAGLYRPRGRQQTVNERLLAAGAAREEVRRLTVLPTNYERVRKAHEQAVDGHASLVDERKGLRAERDRLVTLRTVLPVLVERARVVAERDALEAGGSVEPGTWGERVQHALGRRADLEGERAAAERRVANQDEKLADITVDQPLLDRADRIRTISERIGAYETDTSDRGGLDEERRSAEQAATSLIAVLSDGHPAGGSFDEVGTVVSGRAAFAPARDRWSSARAGVERAADEANTSAVDLEGVKALIAEYGPHVDPEPLRAALAATRARGDLDERVATARSSLENDRVALAQTAGRLGVDPDQVSHVLAQPGPSDEEVTQIAHSLSEVEAAAAVRLARAGELDTLGREMATRLASLDVAGTTPSEEEITERRTAREQTWRSVRKAWLEHVPVTGTGKEWGSDAELAGTYEERTRQADEAADRMWREAERAQEATARAEAQRLRAEATSAYERWRSRWPATATSEDPAGLRAWLGLIGELRTIESRCRTQEQDAEQLEATRRAHREALGQLLVELGTTVPTGELLDIVAIQAQSELGRLDQRAASRTEAVERHRHLEIEFPKHTAALEAAQHEEQAAADALREMLGTFGTTVVGPEAALSTIARLEELAGHLAEMSDKSKRIAGIDRRCEAFLAELEGLRQAAPDIPPNHPATAPAAWRPAPRRPRVPTELAEHFSMCVTALWQNSRTRRLPSSRSTPSSLDSLPMPVSRTSPSWDRQPHAPSPSPRPTGVLTLSTHSSLSRHRGVRSTNSWWRSPSGTSPHWTPTWPSRARPSRPSTRQ
jgi:uncharacterized protein YhaN